MTVTCRQMQEIEARAFGRGVSAGALMKEAGEGIAAVVRQFFPFPGTLVLFLGKGNNAGDALVAARELIKHGWHVRARLAFTESDFKELPAMHWQALAPHLGQQAIDGRSGPLVLLDGLLGIGASGPLFGPLLALAEEMNALRHTRHATTIAMDIPSGLDGDTGVPCAGCVMADITATVAQIKGGLLADSAVSHVGRIALVPLRELVVEKGDGDSKREALTAPMLRPRLPRRPFDFHKGQAGRVGVIAGSHGFFGAALLAASGALRGGAGLVTLLVKEDAFSIVAAKAQAEVMVRAVRDYREVTGQNFDSLAIGPGIGFDHKDEVLEVIRTCKVPSVIDADALTILSQADLSAAFANDAPRLLTPHPGEFARFFAAHPDWRVFDRRRQAESFIIAHPSTTLLLKGARTVIAAHGKPAAFNTTGTPAMATGGMGDVLTGLCAALLAQGVGPYDAACLGAWLCGRSAEIATTLSAAKDVQSIESLTAGDVLQHLGAAFDDLKAGAF